MSRAADRVSWVGYCSGTSSGDHLGWSAARHLNGLGDTSLSYWIQDPSSQTWTQDLIWSAATAAAVGVTPLLPRCDGGDASMSRL